jgi:Fibronectin type III domain
MVTEKTIGGFSNSATQRIRIFAALFVAAGCSAVWATQSVSLAWDPSPDTSIAGYTVHYGDVSGAYPSAFDVGNGTSAVIPGLQDGTVYYFAVTAYNLSRLESNNSNEVSHKTPASGAQNVTLAWNASADTGVAGYTLRYGNGSGVYTSSIDVANNTTASVPGLQRGATYYIIVTAYNSARQESDPSNEVVYQVPVVSHITGPSLQVTPGTRRGDPVRFQFIGSPNQSYELQATEDFETWTAIWHPAPPATSQLLEFADTDTVASGMRFYRLLVH